ncbi:HAD family hydrolase [Candidatus Solirubrobacter pratensis]|uniref:HAD family hydrolase n=1 Tax=Candidatus Solirubrobacter pratensis TaxID=1298857 RepID=UPI000485C5EA|nr:HAD family phosphatase [Candidatus Solirubrobacter pratensis]
MSSAFVFDLDGVLVDSEQAWDAARKDIVAGNGGAWREGAERDMLGMSSKEWPVYLVEELGVRMTPEEVNRAVVDAMLQGYERRLPLLPGAREAVERVAARVPIGLASSSNREVIDVVLDRMGVAELFGATVSSEEVARGKPAPDVYLEAARRLGIDPAAATAVEDSENGIRSAHAAGMRVVAIPNPHFPPAPEALRLAGEVLPGLDRLMP